MDDLVQFVMNSRRELAIGLAMILFSVFALAGFWAYGVSKRTYLEKHSISRIGVPHEALGVWQSHGLRGRVLILFDEKLNARREVEGVTPENYVYRAIEGNIIRKIYHILPSSSWPRVEAAISRKLATARDRNGYRLTVEGTPLLIRHLDAFTPPAEEALVLINARAWSPEELTRIAGLIKDGAIKADMVMVTDEGSAPVIAGLGGMYAPE